MTIEDINSAAQKVAELFPQEWIPTARYALDEFAAAIVAEAQSRDHQHQAPEPVVAFGGTQ